MAGFSKKRITIMLIPHKTNRPYKISISKVTIYFLLFIWLGSITWASLVISQKLNYTEVISANKFLREKVIGF